MYKKIGSVRLCDPPNPHFSLEFIRTLYKIIPNPVTMKQNILKMKTYHKIKKIAIAFLCISSALIYTYCKGTTTRELAVSQSKSLKISKDTLIGYSPSISADGKTIIYETDINSECEYNIYLSYKTADGWSKPYYMKSINSESWDAGPCLTYDQNYLIITSARKGGQGKEDLWISRRSGRRWLKPVNMGRPINSPGYEGFASLSPDGNTLYLTQQSAKEKEIWGCGFYLGYAEKKNGKWQKPKKMPAPVNSGNCEFGPRIMADGKTLIFSSDRVGGFGGYDLYRSTLQDDGSWSEPVNLGSRINSKAHETLASIPASGDTIYFSRRQDKYTSRIFSAPIQAPDKESGVITVSGTVRNARNPDQTLSAEIKITDINRDDITIVIDNNAEDGTYMIILGQGKVYDISVWSEEFTFYSKVFNLKEENHFKNIHWDILLEPIKAGTKIILHNIYFEHDSHELLPASKYELQRVVDLMKLQSGIKVEISGHTDDTGSQDYNMKLSQKRAESVMNYLVSHGIKPDRLKAKGYGQTRRIDTSETEEGRSKNRRVEFEILKVN